jgi:hypothetical protein
MFHSAGLANLLLLGCPQESSGSGSCRGPLSPNISSRVCSPARDIAPVNSCVAMWHRFPHSVTSTPSPRSISFSLIPCMHQVCSASFSLSRMDLVRESTTSAAVISRSPNGTAPPAKRSACNCRSTQHTGQNASCSRSTGSVTCDFMLVV